MHGLIASELSIFCDVSRQCFLSKPRRKKQEKTLEVLLQMSQMFFGFLRERLFWAHVGHPATFVSP